ncbi:hypothetical protein [Plantibacter sp. YIM 135249]|uniref:hypothetical protein n=1 Tax=Plantibacter sp. YIM 135249 TaxID=3423918 RepID=UPI003D35571B
MSDRQDHTGETERIDAMLQRENPESTTPTEATETTALPTERLGSPNTAPDATTDWFPMGATGTERLAAAGLGGTSAPGAAPTVSAPSPSQGSAASPVQATLRRRSARFGTILWGVLVLTFAAAVVTNAVSTIAIDPVTWIIGALIGVGAILVVAGIAAAIRR